MEYSPSRRGLFLAAPTRPVRAVRNVNSPSPPNAQMNLRAGVSLSCLGTAC